jgi:hypothetical protein
MEGMAEETPLAEQLVLSLEQATNMAKQLQHTTTDPTHLLQIYTSLHQAHQHLSTFLSKTQFPPQPPAAENSFSSATGAVAGDENDTDPMQIMDSDDAVEEAEENSKGIVERVEEKMRNCFIKNKRPKRRLSPSAVAVAEERRLYDDGYGGGVKGFDPRATRLRALDLVYQFHG